MQPPGFEPGSLAWKDFTFSSYEKEFFDWLRNRVGKEHANAIIRALRKHFSDKPFNIDTVRRVLNNVKRGKRILAMAIRNFIKFAEEEEIIDENTANKIRQIAKIPKSGVDLYIPGIGKVIDTYHNITNEKYKLLYKVLACSGIRLREGILLFKQFDPDKLIINGEVAKYPLSHIRATKKAYFVYLPAQVAKELKKMELSEFYARKCFRKAGLPAKYLRKWNYNFILREGRAPADIVDFIQGRSPITIGSMHYLEKEKQADWYYSKVVKRLIEMFSEERKLVV